MVALAALVLGLAAGLAVTQRWRPLLLERWHGLLLLPILLLAALLPSWLAGVAPQWLWAEDRRLLLGLLVLRYGLIFCLITINLWPWPVLQVSRISPDRATRAAGRPRIHWYHRMALSIVAIGLAAEAAVLLLNRGYMPVSTAYLLSIADPAELLAVQNHAWLTKQLISETTRLAWLGQTWNWPFLAKLHLAVFPFVSPAEVVTAGGLFLLGFSQFFDGAPWQRRLRQQNQLSGAAVESKERNG
jgi:hypothetical protein